MDAYCRPGKRAFCGAWVLVCLLVVDRPCQGQLGPSISFSGVEAAEARKAAKKMEERRGNIKIGSAEFSFSGGIKQEYNDNIGLSSTQRMDDFITSPHVGAQVYWPISELNALNLNLGLGFNKYLSHPELDTENLLVAPGTVFEFDFYVADVHFNVHDRLSIQQDPVLLSQLSNVATFQRISNTAGISADWDLNKVKLNAGYDYNTFASIENRFSFLDQSTDNFYGGVGVQVASPYLIGVQGAYSRTKYDQDVQNDGTSGTTAAFVNAAISRRLQGQVSVGYQSSTFDRGGSIGDNSDFNSVIYSASVIHRANRWLDHSLAVSQSTAAGIGYNSTETNGGIGSNSIEIHGGIGSNFTEIHGVNYQATAEVARNVSSSIVFSYQFFNDSQSATSENGERYTFTLQLSYQFIKDTSCNLGYQRTEKDSSLIRNDYEQNRVYVDFTHRF